MPYENETVPRKSGRQYEVQPCLSPRSSAKGTAAPAPYCVSRLPPLWRIAATLKKKLSIAALKDAKRYVTRALKVRESPKMSLPTGGGRERQNDSMYEGTLLGAMAPHTLGRRGSLDISALTCTTKSDGRRKRGGRWGGTINPKG